MSRAGPRTRWCGALLALCLALSGCTCGPGPEGDDGGEDAGPEGNDGGQTGDGGPKADAGPDGGPVGCGYPYNTSTLLAGELSSPRGLAVDGTTVYVLEAGLLGQGDGQLWRLSLSDGGTDGGARIPLFINGLESPESLAQDTTDLFLLDGPGSSGLHGLWRVNKSNGQTLHLASVLNNSAAGGTALALSDTAVVIATGRRFLSRVSKSGGAPVDLFTTDAGAQVRGAALEVNTVYFLVANAGAASSGIFRVPVSGGAAVRVRPEPASGNALLLTPGDFYWTEGSNGAGKLRRAPRDGGAAVDLATGFCEPGHLALSGGQLFIKDSTLCAAPGLDAGTARTGFLRVLSLCDPSTARPVGVSGHGPGDVIPLPGGGALYSSQGPAGQGTVGLLP